MEGEKSIKMKREFFVCLFVWLVGFFFLLFTFLNP